MPRANPPILAFNKGLLDPLALARVDLDRTQLSAEVMTNWLPKTQGAMKLRPGTKFIGNSYNDTGAYFIEFVASTDDTALIELTAEKMRVWIDDELLARPHVGTTLSINDTGWSNASTGGAATLPSSNLLPQMTAETTGDVTITASSSGRVSAGGGFNDYDSHPFYIADQTNKVWADVSAGGSALPSWVKFDFGAGNMATVGVYTVKSGYRAEWNDNAPRSWFLEANDADTGSDPGSWTVLDTGGNQTGWATSERRTFTVPLPGAYRFYRLRVTEANGDTELIIDEVELKSPASVTQAKFSANGLKLNATAIGSRAIAKKRVIVDTGDLGVEHSLAIQVASGPVTLRVGSTDNADDFISETDLGTGYHNLAFTPDTNFYVTLQSGALVDRVVSSISIGDTGTLEIVTPWLADNLDDVRTEQSADVVYIDCAGLPPRKIERRGTGRSWSIVKYEPETGPFQPSASSSAKLRVDDYFGNVTMRSDIPFFKPQHIGSLMRLFHNGQNGRWRLGAIGATTDPIEMTGINDTGNSPNGERRIVFDVSGTWSGEMTIERSFDGPELGFHKSVNNNLAGSNAADTGTRTFTITDPDDNLHVWYRARVTAYNSGVAIVNATYKNGGKTGIARITDYSSSTEVSAEVLRRFSDTGYTDNWQEGSWSDVYGYPTSVALHEGRLFHAGHANINGSVSDDYENFDEEVEGESAPIARTLGSGPVDSVSYLVSLLRLIAGTAGSELAIRSSSLDEPLTATNSSVKAFSTQGSAPLRALVVDNQAVFVQRSKRRLSAIGFGQDVTGDYIAQELSFFVPELLAPGVVSIAVQRRPDTRIHCVREDGVVAILTYEPQQDVLCWSLWETDGVVERAMCLPGVNEDKVYYHVNRDVNGVTKRFLEKWAMETECRGDTGLSWLADCAVSYSDTGGATEIPVPHLIGKNLIAWANDTGQTDAGMDMSPDDTGGHQTLYAVDTGGDIVLPVAKRHVVAGLPYTANYKSTKLAYAAAAGTALAQMKRVDKLAFILNRTHNNGLFFGSDTGHLDPLPRVTNAGAVVDPDTIFQDFDEASMPFPGLWNTDSRICLKAKAPRPATVMAIIPTVQTDDKV